MITRVACLLALFAISFSGFAQRQKTYCNPINIDYGFTPIPNFSEWGRHRATADPVIVTYKGDYYLFSTNQWGYWWSNDMLNWKFLSRDFLRPWINSYDNLCAPAVGVIGDTMLVFGSTYTSHFTLWMSTDPKKNEWKPLLDSFEIGGWDPAFFTDEDDGKLYMYNGSSNVYPMYVIELDRKTFHPKGTRKEIYRLEDWRYGWQRFGEYLDNTFLSPFAEGATMNKHNGKYYFQYGAPATEFSGYGDGVLVGEGPLGPFTAQSDPYSYKPGGFARGAGHGATFQDPWKNYWHVSTIVVGVKNNFERRLGIWPAGFDKKDMMFCNTSFGDYPHYLPGPPGDSNASKFTGWMLLNYGKPVTVSSTLGSYSPNFAVDESIKTYWSAASGNKGEWIQTDLGELSTVNAVQINYADQDADILGKRTDIFHKYILYYSSDGKKWKVLADKSANKTDVPHDYIELGQPVEARFLKLVNHHMAAGKFAVSGLRAFGRGKGSAPEEVRDFVVLRTEKDKRSAWIRWKPSSDAYAYNIYYGPSPDQLYTCIMVHSANDYFCKSLDLKSEYYFSIEAVNENGVSTRTKPLKVD